jgi:nitrogenase-stabilizing/protective protein
MNLTLDNFKKLTDAEEYFEFFELPYDRNLVNVNRLHILKQYSNLSQEEKLSQYRDALLRAYEVFLSKTSLETKLFKVFNEKPKGIVMLSDIHS